MIRRVKKTLLNSGYEVILTDNLRGCGRGNYPYVKGMLLPESDQILIKKSLDIDERIITLIHEILHEMFPLWMEEKIESASRVLFELLDQKNYGFFEFWVSF